MAKDDETAPQIRDRIKELRRVPAEDLTANPRNWRRHPKRQREALRAMLEDVGFAGAVLARETEAGDLEIIDGHLRAETAPDAEIPVLILDVDEDEANRLLATIDPLAQMADTDPQALRDLLDQVSLESEDLERWLKGQAAPGEGATGETDPDEVPGVTVDNPPVAAPGDVWILGDHRLLVGDAREAGDLERLLAGDTAAMAFIDPPYGIDYEGFKKGWHGLEGDRLERDNLVAFLVPALRLIAEHTADEAALYCWHHATTRAEFDAAMLAAGWQEHAYIIWAKPAIVLGGGDYRPSYEPCIYAGKAGQDVAYHGTRAEPMLWRVDVVAEDGERAVPLGPGLIVSDGEGNEIYVQGKVPKRKQKSRHVRIAGKGVWLAGDQAGNDVWEIDRPANTSYQHPTQKPVELARRAIENSSRRGEIVLDTFLGSGTTIIGAEQAARRAYAIEIEPIYADVAIRRWQAFVGDDARREADGATFDDAGGDEPPTAKPGRKTRTGRA